MAQYGREEIMSSSEVVRNFGAVLNSVVQHQREKIAIVRNNHLEAVLVAADVYEKLEQAATSNRLAQDRQSEKGDSERLLQFLQNSRMEKAALLPQEAIDHQIAEEREAWD
jgi:PHD/YefM family antitoxin component YafN of YafNO toxin-antitoxin module